MATGISTLTGESNENFFLKFQEEHDIQKEKERKFKATQFRKRMRNHCKGLNNCENSSDDDIIIIDDSPGDKKDKTKIDKKTNSERKVRSRKNPNKEASAEQTTNDEILARKLQEEFDHEYATSLDSNFDNLNRINNDDNRNQDAVIPERIENNTDDQTLSFARRRSETNNSDLTNEFNFLNNNNFMLQFLADENQQQRPRIPQTYNRRNRRQVPSFLNRIRTLNRTNPLIRSDRDFTADDYEALLMLDENVNVKKILTKQEWESLPLYPYKENNQNQEENKCSICFESYKKGENLTSLACLHKFHTECVKDWLLKESRKCPLCQNDAINGNV